MKVIFTEIAAKEFLEAQSFYELEIQGLGKEFKNEIIKTVKRISIFPDAYPLLQYGIRKCVVRKFPYNLYYSVESDFILILSVAHQHRKPFYLTEK